ncbi:MAG: hypothetical protein ACU85E_08635 [Gammaproteobacteria bacterium]
MSFNSQLKQLHDVLNARILAIRYDWYVLTGLLLLSIIGVGFTDAYEKMSHWYWLAMVPVFFGACLLMEWKTSREHGMPLRALLIKQVQHWLGLLAGVYLTFFLRELGSLDNETTGLILLLIFALTTYLAGVTMGWLFRLLGFFLGLCLIMVAYLENYIWLITASAFLILILYSFLIRKFGYGRYD